jgi:hypothetical protein
MAFGQDQNGPFKPLADGRVLRIQERMFNSILTLSSSQRDHGWSHGW